MDFLSKAIVEPTNNQAERQLRPIVIWRKLSFDTQSERGSRFVERIFTVTRPGVTEAATSRHLVGISKIDFNVFIG